MKMKGKDGKMMNTAKFGKELKDKMAENKHERSTQDTDSTKIIY